MRLNAPEILSRLNSSYWFVPLMVTLVGVGLALACLQLDTRITLDPDGPWAVLTPASADGARALLSAIIGAMITVISLTFSVSIVALTVAATHFGPRVLNNFVRQTSAQVVLGTFMATFAYAVLALGSIRGSGPTAELPELTVSGAVVLVAVSIGALIYYVHHVSTTLQIGEIAWAIVTDLRESVAAIQTEPEAQRETPCDAAPEAPPDACEILSTESGYVQRIDQQAVVRLAAGRDAVVWMRREPGAFLVAGTPLALVHPASICDRAFAHAVRHACVVGRDRTLWQDPEFAVKQLVEIALRALSPAVNEPFTAVTCIDRLTEALACVAKAPPPRHAWTDDEGHVRLYVQPQPFGTLLRASYDPIRIFAGPNPAIHARLLESIAELGLVVRRPEDLEILRAEAEAIRRAAMHEIREAEDLAFVEARYEQAMEQLAGKPASSRR